MLNQNKNSDYTNNKEQTEQNTGAETISNPEDSFNAHGQNQNKPHPKHAKSSGQAPARRIGTATMGITLVLVGILLIIFMFKPFDIFKLMKFSPILLILLGVEMLWQYFSSHGQNLKYDFWGTLFCFFVIFASLGTSLLYPIYMEYGPANWRVEQQLENDVYDQLYLAIPENLPVASLEVNSNLLSAPPSRQEFSISDLTSSDHIHFYVTLKKEKDVNSFAQNVRRLLDVIASKNYPRFSIRVEAPNDNGTYVISLDDRFSMRFSSQEIAQETENRRNYDDYEEYENLEEPKIEDTELAIGSSEEI